MITTERLILRPFTENDAADLLEYLHEPTVHCFFDMKISSMDEAKEEAVKRKETDCYFAIELKDTGKVIGEIFVHPDGEGMEEDCSEGGYSDDTYSPCWMLNKDYHGKGYAYEAARAVFDYLFNVKGARRIIISQVRSSAKSLVCAAKDFLWSSFPSSMMRTVIPSTRTPISMRY